MRLIQKRMGWLILILIAGGAAIFIGQQMFASSGCPQLQSVLLYSTTGLLIFLMGFSTLLSRSDAPITMLRAPVIVLVFGLVIPTVMGAVLSRDAGVKSVFCPSCTEALVRAQKFYDNGQLDTAEDLARACFDEARDTSEEKRQAGKLIAEIRDQKAEIALKNRQCAQVSSHLDQAEQFAKEFNVPLVKTIQQRRENFELICSPTPVATAPPTITSSPTPTQTPTRIPTPTLSPTATPRPPGVLPCDLSTMRFSELIIRDQGKAISIPIAERRDISIPRTGSIDLYGAAYLSEQISYEVRFAPIDTANLPRAEWRTIGQRKPAPVGNDYSNGLLVIWEEQERNLPAGRYALAIRMFLPNGNYTLERDMERCWAFVVIQ